MKVPKTIRNQFNKYLELKYFIEAYERAKKNKSNRREVMTFVQKLEFNLLNIIDSIKNNTYHVSKYSEFVIYEPKKRIIRKLPFKDRIVHQWYVECFIKEYFVKRFIYDSYACIEGKGTHKCIIRTQTFMRRMKKEYGNYYVVQFDISKFFYSIDKRILLDILSKKINDNKLLEFTKILLYDSDSDDIGLPIGNYTSQYFELDYYIKHEHKIKYYIRYLDDFICLVKDKCIAKYVYNKIECFVNNKLNLKLNPKSRYYPSKLGINFCGFIIHEEYKLLRKRCKKNIINKIKLYKEGKVSNDEYKRSMASFIGHIKWANSYNFKIKYNLV